MTTSLDNLANYWQQKLLQDMALEYGTLLSAQSLFAES